MKRIAIIDGSNLIFKSFFAVPLLSTSYGQPTNAVIGSLKSFKSLVNDIRPNYVLIIWDNGKKTFRHHQDPTYKAQRPPAPDDLKSQFAIVQDIFGRLAIPQAIAPIGTECDDLIGTIATQSADAGFDTIIVSSDRDFYQLCRPNLRVYSYQVKKKDPEGNGLVDVAYVEKIFGCTPEQTVCIKSLTGEKCDNIAGIPGIGPKTATALIQEHGNISSLVAYAKANPTSKHADKILSNLSIIKNAYELARIQTDLDLPAIPVMPVDMLKINHQEIRDFFEHYEMKSFLSQSFHQWTNIFSYSQKEINYAQRKIPT